MKADMRDTQDPLGKKVGVLAAIFAVALAVVTISVASRAYRRCHDKG